MAVFLLAGRDELAGEQRVEESAALDLAYVAAGRYDGFWEIGLSPWDMAAGALLVREAGGLVGDLHGEETYLQSGRIVASNAKLFASMLKVLHAKG